MTTAASSSEKAWTAIDQERRRDRLLRRISIVAWSVTCVIVLLFTILFGLALATMIQSAMMGYLPWMSVAGIAYPLVIVLGTVSLSVATLSTIAIFLRHRTASLSDIQLRLAALEDMLTSRDAREEKRS